MAFPWSLIGLIWAYNLGWLAGWLVVVVDTCKLGFCRMFDHQAAGTTTWQQWLHKPLDAFGGLHRK